MGKRLIVPGADFSANGFKTENFMDVELANGVPFKFYFFPTAPADAGDVNNYPTIPNDAVLNTVSDDGIFGISGNYASFGFFFGNAIEDVDSVAISYDKTLTDAKYICSRMRARIIDLRGLSFGTSQINAAKMFLSADIGTLKMPDMYISDANNMFYNFNVNYYNAEIDFSFIKKVGSTVKEMFKYCHTRHIDLRGVDVSSVTIFNNCFEKSDAIEINLADWDFSHGNYGLSMFNSNPNLSTIHLDNFNNTTGNFAVNFGSCPRLTTVFVTNASVAAKTILLNNLNSASAGGSSNWVESTVEGKAALVKGS